MRLYLAGPYQSRFFLNSEVAPLLRKFGHIITSSWIQEPKENDESWHYLRGRREGSRELDPLQDQILEKIATRDYRELQTADILVKFPVIAGAQSSGGKFTEMGMALALAMDVCVIGTRESIFEYLPHVSQYYSYEEFMSKHLGADYESVIEARKILKNETGSTFPIKDDVAA